MNVSEKLAWLWDLLLQAYKSIPVIMIIVAIFLVIGFALIIYGPIMLIQEWIEKKKMAKKEEIEEKEGVNKNDNND